MPSDDGDVLPHVETYTDVISISIVQPDCFGDGSRSVKGALNGSRMNIFAIFGASSPIGGWSRPRSNGSELRKGQDECQVRT